MHKLFPLYSLVMLASLVLAACGTPVAATPVTVRNQLNRYLRSSRCSMEMRQQRALPVKQRQLLQPPRLR